MAMKKKPKKAVIKKAVKKAKVKKGVTSFAKSLAKETEKMVKKEAKVESLESILQEADRAFSDMVRRYYTLGRCYVKATRLYGVEGKKAFIARFPLTENALHNLELVGTGKLLPHFAMCSNKFTTGLVNMIDSMEWQRKLASITKGNVVKVVIDGETKEVPLEKFLENPKLVLDTLSEEDKSISPLKLAEKIEKLRNDARAHFLKQKRPAYKFCGAGNGMTIRFYKSIPYTSKRLRELADELDAAAAR